jgi:predicted O-linked N-acetylglucosamine transferase (SPINDLY family)
VPALDADDGALARARASARSGQWELAERLYRDIVRGRPDQVDALEGLGLLALQTRRSDEARTWLERAHALAPGSARIVGHLGLALRQSGQLERALACYEDACRLDPSDPALLVNRARAERDAGRLGDAIASFRRALALRPAAADVWSMLSNALRESGDTGEALQAARRALAIDPRLHDAHLNEGAALQLGGANEQAAISYVVAAGGAATRRPALANLARLAATSSLPRDTRELAVADASTGLGPEHAPALDELARAARDAGRPATAIGCLERALALAPSAPRQRELAAVLDDAGHADAARDRWLTAIELAPGDAAGYRGLGASLGKRGRIAGVEERWARALATCPDDPEALLRLGQSAQRLGQPSEAARLYARLARSRPELPEVHFYLGTALTKQGRHRAAHAAYERAIALDPRSWVAHSNLLFGLHFDPDASPEAISASHRAFGEGLEAALAERRTPPAERCRGALDPGRRLRIAYVSPDLCAHAVSHFIEPVLSEHDPDALEVYCYSDARRPDAVTERLARLVPHFVDTASWSHDALFDRIRADGIDLLVDLAGHTGRNRLPVFARRPCPVQVSWLGYFDTTGLSSIDYRIADAASVPAHLEHLFVERVVRLPRSANCFQPPPAPDPSPPPCLERGHVTFGYFNNPTKLGRHVVAAAARILHATPGARLRLKYRSFDEPDLQARVAGWFAQDGIEARRLEFSGHGSMDTFLRAVAEVDVALDPFPYSGETTALHALWMGVPVITLEGSSLVARLGSRVLRVGGLHEWVATSSDEYVSLATRVAADRDGLVRARRELRERLTKSPLLDARGVTRELEAAYREMWRAYCATA